MFLQVIISFLVKKSDAAYWRTQMVEVVLKEAMAKVVGMRMEWLEKK